MPADTSQLEDKLRAAYSDVAATVQPEDISELAPAPTSPVRWRAAATTGRRRTALAAAAAVLLIVITATVIPQVLQSGSRHSNGGPGAAGHVPHSHMAYVTTKSDQLIPIDLDTGTPLAPIPLGVKGYDGALATSPDGKMVYVLTARGQLVPVNVRTGKAGHPINFGGISQAVVTTANGKAAYVLQPPYGVVVVGLTTRTVLGFIKIHDARSFALTPNGKTLYVLSSSAVSTGTGPVLTAIDTAANTIIATIELHAPGGISGFVLPRSLAMAPDGKTVYTAFDNVRGTVAHPRSTDVIIPVDVASNTERTPIVSGTGSGFLWNGLAISPDSQTGYLQQAQSLIPVDLHTGAVRGPIPVSHLLGGTYEVTFSPDSHRLYLIRNTDHEVVPIDTATGTAMQPIQLGARSWGARQGVFAPGGNATLYVLSYYIRWKTGSFIASRMTPVDVTTGAVGKPIEFPGGPSDIVFGP